MRKRMTMLELYEHVRTVGIGALIAAAILVAVGVVIPLLPPSQLFSQNAAARYVPSPRPRPLYQPQYQGERAETAMLSSVLGPRAVPTERFTPIPTSTPVAERWPAQPVREPQAVPPLNLAPLTEHLTRVAVRDIKNKRETKERATMISRTEQATCRTHGLRTVWEGRYRWRCRR